jgi:enoyl-CoA hydratase/carnithine racemase
VIPEITAPSAWRASARCARHRAGGRRHGLLRRRQPELDAPHGRLHRAENLPTRALWPRCCAIYECPKPTIARVQGDVYAGGMGLVAACDMAVAAEGAGFCLSEVKIGLMPGTISPYVMRAMGARAGHRYFLTGERFDAAEALRIGFVHQVVAAERWTTPWTACSRRCWRPGPRCAPARSWCWTWPSAKSTPS